MQEGLLEKQNSSKIILENSTEIDKAGGLLNWINQNPSIIPTILDDLNLLIKDPEIIPNGIDRKAFAEYLNYVSTTGIEKEKDIKDILELRMKVGIRCENIPSFLNYVMYLAYQNKLIKSAPSVIILPESGVGTYGACYDILKNEVILYGTNHHNHATADNIKGCLLHEVGHFVYSFTRKTAKEYYEDLKKLSRLEMSMVNLLEDVRIDTILQKKYFFARQIYSRLFSIYAPRTTEEIKKMGYFPDKRSVLHVLMAMTKHHCYAEAPLFPFPSKELPEEIKQLIESYEKLIEDIKKGEDIEDVVLKVREFMKSQFPEESGKSQPAGKKEETQSSESRKEESDLSEKPEDTAEGNENDLLEKLEELIKKEEEGEGVTKKEGEFSKISENITSQLNKLVDNSVKDFLKDKNTERTGKGMLSSVDINTSELSRNESLFINQSIVTMRPPDSLIKFYIKGLRDANEFNRKCSITRKGIKISDKGRRLDMRRFVKLSSGLSKDERVFRHIKEGKPERVNVDFVIDTSGSMSIVSKHANMMIAYLMGLQDGLIDRNIMKVNFFLIGGDDKSLCLPFHDVIKKIVRGDKYGIKSLQVVNAIKYHFGIEGLSAYFDQVYSSRKQNDWIFFITDAQFVNSNDWKTLKDIKKMYKRPHLVGFYVTDGNDKQTEKNLTEAFDEHHIFSPNAISKTTKTVMNEYLKEIDKKAVRTV